jgi:hypothetical protein
MIPLVYRRLAQLGKVAGALTFLFGIPYGIFQYWQIQKDKMTEQTLGFYKLYNATPITTYREQASKVLSKHKADIIAGAEKGEAELTRALVGAISDEQAETSVTFVIDFFDGIAVCVYDGLCHPDTTYRLFGGIARDHYVNFYQFIMVQRSGLAPDRFGRGLETIAKAAPSAK